MRLGIEDVRNVNLIRDAVPEIRGLGYKPIAALYSSWHNQEARCGGCWQTLELEYLWRTRPEALRAFRHWLVGLEWGEDK